LIVKNHFTAGFGLQRSRAFKADIATSPDAWRHQRAQTPFLLASFSGKDFQSAPNAAALAPDSGSIPTRLACAVTGLKGGVS
jgi:hypothetical protein